jgi:hypothetical protein
LHAKIANVNAPLDFSNKIKCDQNRNTDATNSATPKAAAKHELLLTIQPRADISFKKMKKQITASEGSKLEKTFDVSCYQYFDFFFFALTVKQNWLNCSSLAILFSG